MQIDRPYLDVDWKDYKTPPKYLKRYVQTQVIFDNDQLTALAVTMV